MPRLAPATALETHDVTNQPSEFARRDLYRLDRPLREAVLREAGQWFDGRMDALVAEIGTEHMLELGDVANRFPPELVIFDRYGRRVDEARFHPAYHELMATAMRHGIHDLVWTVDQPGAHDGHVGRFVFHPREFGVGRLRPADPATIAAAIVTSTLFNGSAPNASVI